MGEERVAPDAKWFEPAEHDSRPALQRMDLGVDLQLDGRIANRQHQQVIVGQLDRPLGERLFNRTGERSDQDVGQC